MKLASIRYAGQDRIAILRDDSEVAFVEGFTSMLDLIRSGEDAARFASKTTVSLREVEWRPPIPYPGKICCVAMNNSASNARKISAPDHPAFFLKPPSCLIGHGQIIRIRRYYGSVHPEPELAIVIGKTARDVDAVSAPDYVFGYTIFNDITGNGMRAEDMFHYWALYTDPENPDELQRREQHLSYAARYKGSDTFGSMGPVLVTTDEIDDPDNLDVTCTVGGELVAEDSTRYYNYKVAEILSFISQFQTLEPGDVISCGTAFKPSENRKSIHHANFQNVAGPVEVTISGIGTLVNTIEIEDRPIGKWRLNRSNDT
jgi:2-keto-4-pentenoate hydratase/2-oxohepta-3-ene-1,7-dioic acid hydratase in catechol pathway